MVIKKKLFDRKEILEYKLIVLKMKMLGNNQRSYRFIIIKISMHYILIGVKNSRVISIFVEN